MPGNYNNSNKTAIITGATSGIGYELAKIFAHHNFDLFLVARTDESLQKVAEELSSSNNKISVEYLAIDLMVPGASKQVYQFVQQKGATVEVLVNDAGQGEWGKFIETDLDREIDLIHLNAIAPLSLTKYFLKDMIAGGSGKILQVASSLAKAPSPYMSVYAATKAFLYSFAEAMVIELKGTGVTMTSLLPGATDTDFFHKAGAAYSTEYREASLYNPAEVAKAAFDGLMDGKDKVVPGVKNKIAGIMGSILPDKMVASNMEGHMETSDAEQGRNSITHARSAEERERIKRETGNESGDSDKHAGHRHEAL